MENFIAVFADLSDPRAANARHDLLELLVVALAAVLCGAESCAEMALFGQSKEGLLRQFLRLEHGIPSHDTFSRLFRLLEPEAFEAAFRRFMASFAKELAGVVAIDGKAVRGAFERGGRTTPLQLVNVWAAEQRLLLAQRIAPNRNEVAAALEILKLLSLKGCIVTADALHCHKAMARAVLDSGAEYVLVLKENQAALLADAERAIAAGAQPDKLASEQSRSHDRSDSRHAVVVPDETLAVIHQFPGIRAVGRIEYRRHITGKGTERLVRHFLLSRELSAEELLRATRAHWTIENQLHWVLDVVFNEDGARNRKDHGPANLALLRKLALNLLRLHPDKGSIRGKVKRAGWDDRFLLSLFAQMR
ncbi:MAG TPA: ISAs1 family transposase [Stellaceae bacterium]|nr:ISAs1 family transposase [Stellaceae bacterium]